jgi:hypothetical protein
MGGGLSAYDIVNAGEKLDLKQIAIYNDPEENGGEGVPIDEDDGDLGNTCLTQAIKATIYNEKHRYRVVENILQRGSDVNQLTALDETPLHTAAYMNRPDLMQLLIEKNSLINATAQGGWTPLHFAALAGNLDCIKILLEQPSINVHGTVGAKYAGKTAMDLAFLRLKRSQHENALSYENDDWTFEEITHATQFFQCFDTLDKFIHAEKYAKDERKRMMRRIRNPFEPIYDRKGRRKVYCTNCNQGYWSRTHNKFGKCPECRGNDKEEERKLWEAAKDQRIREREIELKDQKNKRNEERRRDKQRVLYSYPERNEVDEVDSAGNKKDFKFEHDITRLWNAALNTRALLADDFSINQKYYRLQSQIGNSISDVNKEQEENERLGKEILEKEKPKYKIGKLW